MPRCAARCLVGAGAVQSGSQGGCFYTGRLKRQGSDSRFRGNDGAKVTHVPRLGAADIPDKHRTPCYTSGMALIKDAGGGHRRRASRPHAPRTSAHASGQHRLPLCADRRRRAPTAPRRCGRWVSASPARPAVSAPAASGSALGDHWRYTRQTPNALLHFRHGPHQRPTGGAPLDPTRRGRPPTPAGSTACRYAPTGADVPRLRRAAAGAGSLPRLPGLRFRRLRLAGPP